MHEFLDRAFSYCIGNGNAFEQAIPLYAARSGQPKSLIRRRPGSPASPDAEGQAGHRISAKHRRPSNSTPNDLSTSHAISVEPGRRFPGRRLKSVIRHTTDRRTMSHSRHADRASSPEQSEHPRKRQKTIGSALSGDEDAQFNTVRQSKACSNCRKVKVKCVPAEEGRASGRCARCLRLDIVCLRQKKSWTAGDTIEDEASQLSKMADSYECGNTL